MAFRITQLFPDSRQFRTDIPDGIIHKVIGPAACFPAEFTVVGIHPYVQPINSRIIYSTLLQERHVGIDINIYSPYVSIPAFDKFIVNRIPPPLTWSGKCIVECLFKMFRQKIHFP
jgi:hypothetical protein